MIVIVIIKFL